MNFGVSLGGVVPASGVTPLPSIPGANIRFLGHGHFEVTLDVIAQTGSAITTLLDIPFAHELTTIMVKHTDANRADSTDAQTVTFNHRYGNLWFNVWTINAGVASDNTNTLSAAGKINTALEFEKINNEYINISWSTTPQQYSISFWIKLNSLNTNPGNDYQSTISSQATDNFILIEEDGTVSHRVPGVTSANFKGNTILNVGTWAHVCCVYNQNVRQIYVNGVFDKEEVVGAGTVDFGTAIEFGRNYGIATVYPTNLNRFDVLSNLSTKSQ